MLAIQPLNLSWHVMFVIHSVCCSIKNYFLSFHLQSLIMLLTGYVRLVTNFGPLNLELYCDMLPKTCENFLKLAQRGCYDGVRFHRSIRNFMVCNVKHYHLLMLFNIGA
jgi:hypothetical protein